MQQLSFDEQIVVDMQAALTFSGSGMFTACCLDYPRLNTILPHIYIYIYLYMQIDSFAWKYVYVAMAIIICEITGPAQDCSYKHLCYTVLTNL